MVAQVVKLVLVLVCVSKTGCVCAVVCVVLVFGVFEVAYAVKLVPVSTYMSAERQLRSGHERPICTSCCTQIRQCLMFGLGTVKTVRLRFKIESIYIYIYMYV